MSEVSNSVGQSLRPEEGSESAVDRVTAEVRRAVLSGALPSGRTFSTAELSAQLGVSHIPVREALRRLDAQGLIVLRPGRKAMVSPLDRDELRAVFRLRQQIEPDLAAWSVSMLRADDLDRANTLLTAYIHGSGDIDELWDSHHELHLALLRPAASEWDLRILAQLWHASDRYTRVVFDPYAVSEHLSDNEVACLEGIAALRGSSEPAVRAAKPA
jgi:DNA-binding GntR family transcriptional regulator